MRSRAVQGTWTGTGEVLIGGSLYLATLAPHPGSARKLRWPIPFDVSLSGLELHAQGLCRSTTEVAGSAKPLTRATLSNALDLVLGF